ncbi:hypothetical protein [Nostoc sp. UHCC 0870]|uniref:hypothetical protein n=1 Tax=Nostoc sp. UHCC 0870 TaxID=2914041 RepID=UPI001EE0687F|nr:hypothetical protein [Nostoc sp. UHCC 0870]UKO99082.1 hypothetical protein L6494_04995 [Nostoc sp. UHCC 0870]
MSLLAAVGEVIDDELEQTPEGERKQQMMILTGVANTKILANEQVKYRARQLAVLGFKAFDAAHIACAETGNADVLLTTDDRMMRLAARYSAMLQVRVENPLRWVLEVIDARRN